MDAHFNLLVSASPRAPARSRREIVARLRAVGDPAPLVIPTERRGVMVVRTSLDAREAIRRLQALHRDAPAAFRYTSRWLPVDAWTAAEPESLRPVVAALRDRIRPGERWRMSIERRATGGPAPADLIVNLASLIDNEVDLVHPDRVVRIELFRDRAAVSVVAPAEVFSVVAHRHLVTSQPGLPGEHGTPP
jgi:tRNA(Ser,Leu) C12 N-acetylase TAN1